MPVRHCKKYLMRLRGGQRSEQGRYSLVKENLARPQRPVREDERINSSPSTLREFVALFCTERRNKRRGLDWEVVGWQGVTDFEESAENYFGRILLT